MKASSLSLPSAQAASATQPPIENLPPVPNVTHYITAEDVDPDQVRVYTSAFTPQLRALIAESGRGESCLND